MRNLLLRHKKTRLHCGLFIVPYSMMTSPNSFQCLNRSVTWGKVKQEEKIIFKSSGRRKKPPGKEAVCRSGGSQETPWP